MAALFELGLTELADLIRRREVSSRQVVEAHLERTAELNPTLNAISVSLAKDALAAADRCDAASSEAATLGPLHGVPFTVKEDLDCLGSATTHGLRQLEYALPHSDAPAVARLRAAGAIPIGRTNLSEMGLRLCAVNPLRGRTLNPFDRSLTAGGSSCGDAVAVATGMTPLGLGGDIGGSLRVPAQCALVAALKPTTGRVPYASSLEPRDLGLAGQLMLALGPVARSVEDLRLALSVLVGRDARDPRSVTAPLSAGQTTALNSYAMEPKRAALVCQLPGAPLDARTSDATARAGDALRTSGWEVDEVSPPELELVNELFAELLASELSVVARRMQNILSDTLLDHLERVSGRHKLNAESLFRLLRERSRLQRTWSGFFEEYPVVVGPNWATPYWRCDADLDPERGVGLLTDTVRFITAGNVLGLPALALPMGVVDGLPTGVQLYADLWREDLCLHTAQCIETVIGRFQPVTPQFAQPSPRG